MLHDKDSIHMASADVVDTRHAGIMRQTAKTIKLFSHDIWLTERVADMSQRAHICLAA